MQEKVSCQRLALGLVWLALGCLAAMTGAAASDAAPTTNLVEDGGFERVRECIVAHEKHIFQLLDSGASLGATGPIVTLPANFSLACGIKRLEVITGVAGREVHSGNRALLLDGSYYLQSGCELKTGDVFLARFFARGTGRVRVILYLVAVTGRYCGQAVPELAAVDSSEWVEVRQRLDTSATPNLRRMSVRLEANGPVVIDDLEVTREPPPVP